MSGAPEQALRLQMLLNEARKRQRVPFTRSKGQSIDAAPSSCASHRNEALTVSLNPHLSARCAGTLELLFVAKERALHESLLKSRGELSTELPRGEL